MQNSKCKPRALRDKWVKVAAAFTPPVTGKHGWHLAFCILNYLRRPLIPRRPRTGAAGGRRRPAPCADRSRTRPRSDLRRSTRGARPQSSIPAARGTWPPAPPAPRRASRRQFRPPTGRRARAGCPGIRRAWCNFRRSHAPFLLARLNWCTDSHDRPSNKVSLGATTERPAMKSERSPGKGKRSGVRATPKGRPVDPRAREDVISLLGDAPRRRDLLIEYLHLIQDRFGCLSAAHLVALAAEMKMAMAEVYEVATFYHHFDVVKDGDARPPAITVRVCDSIACELAGSQELLKTLPATLGTDVRVLHAPCVGRCETAPVAVVGQNPVPHATVDKVAALVRAGAVTHPWSDVLVTPARIDYQAYRADGGYALAASCASGERTAADVIALMEDSGLRGLGGAGFPTGRKWKIVAAEPAPRLMAINIDEGEPGTFKDRYYLERDPHRFLEGALVAAWAVGIDDIYIYLRDEYHGCRA